MNLWARKARLVWIIPALLLFSCEDDLNTIGLDPENNLGIFFVEIPIKDRVSQVWVDNINSRGTGTLLVGNQVINGFGLVKARNFSEILTNSIDIGEGAVFDSLVLELRVSNFTGSNIGGEQIIEVFQLQDSVGLIEIQGMDTVASTYFTSSSQELGTKLGEGNVLLFIDSLNLNVAETNLNSQDSVDAAIIQRDYDQNGDYIYRHSIRLDDTFGQSFFDTDANNITLFNSQNDFNNFFKGIGIVAGENNSSIINYDAIGEFSRMVLYYSEPNAEGVIENKLKAFRFGGLRSYNNMSPNINDPWTGSDFDELTELYTPLVTNTDKAYLQSGTNLFMKIDISDFPEFSDTVDTYIIQNAELVIKGLESVSSLNTPPSRLIYYLTSSYSLASENFSVSSIPADLQNTPQIGIYNSDDNEYRVSIPQFLQVATDSLTFDQIIVAPVSIVNSALSNENARIDNFVVPKEDMSIRFFYTIPDKN